MRCLGLDTSNYTTSAAVFGNDTALNCGKLLDVPQGALGLRQSDAVFQHVRRLHVMMEQLREAGALNDLVAVGASTRPREVEGSYMPCFLVGEGQGRSIAANLDVPFFEFSHQQGHIAAAAWSAGKMDLLDRPHLAWHLSGGTTELLYVEPNGTAPQARCIGGTSDISAGQLIDRPGQILGLAFPAGKMLDKLSQECDKSDRFSVKLKELTFSLSGMENKVRQMFEHEVPHAQIARYVLETLADILVRATKAARQEYGNLPVLFSGGVASNQLLRQRLTGEEIYFAKPEYSTDNALGVAILTQRAMERRETV